ncbi:hypothetical protein Ancab_038064, partial [Ancistrocladus abbreviatus]
MEQLEKNRVGEGKIMTIKKEIIDTLLDEVLCKLLPQEHQAKVAVSASMIFALYCLGNENMILEMRQKNPIYVLTHAFFLIPTIDHSCPSPQLRK